MAHRLPVDRGRSSGSETRRLPQGVGGQMLPEKRIPTHPGEVLLMEFLTPMGLTQVEFAKHLKIPIQRLNEITRGKRGVSPETAWLFAQALGTSPEFWLNLQTAHTLAKAASSQACRDRRGPRQAPEGPRESYHLPNHRGSVRVLARTNPPRARDVHERFGAHRRGSVPPALDPPGRHPLSRSPI